MALIESYSPSPLGEVRSGVVESDFYQILDFFRKRNTLGARTLHISKVEYTYDSTLVIVERSNQHNIPMERSEIIFDDSEEARRFYVQAVMLKRGVRE